MQKPFLKWAGNKLSVVPTIQKILVTLPPATRLIEPFAGSGAVFLNTDYPEALVSDVNADLIQLYRLIQQDVNAFIAEAQTLFCPEGNTAETFYQNRSRFNASIDPVERAALFLYLNKHAFNGLCRFNSKGEFNVPFGQHVKPYFPKIEMQAFAEKAQSATFLVSDFRDTLAMAKRGDVVYCDPPYVPLSETARFTGYAKDAFGMAEQLALAEWARALSAKGIGVILSNHFTPFVESAYEGAQITRLEVRRFISCKGQKRDKASEVLALFYPQSGQPVSQIIAG